MSLAILPQPDVPPGVASVRPTIPYEQRFVLTSVDWKTYDGLLRLFEGRHLRITYDRGTVELMTTSARHERFKKLLARLFEVLTLEMNIPILSLGNFTCRREDLDRGLEPDECYYVQHEAEMRPHVEQDIDLAVSPPPDLAIEVEVTRSVLDRLAIYAALGVPEVWRFDGARIVILYRDVEGAYREVSASVALPQLPLPVLLQFYQQREQLGETGVLRAFQAWVRTNLVAPNESE